LNAKGYHDVDRAPEPPAGMRRIVALGDSFAFGFVPRREGFLARIETSLSRAPRRVEVVNLGVPGIGVDGYEAELVDEGLGMHPDVVLVCFFIGNDFTDRLHPTPIAHSYVLDLVHWLRIARLDAAPHPYSDRGPTLSEADFLLLERNRLRLFDPRGRLLRRNLPWVAAHLARIRDRARRAGATMRVVVLPAEIQVDEVVRGRVLAAAHADPAALDWDAPNRALAGAMRDAGIPSLDVLDSFRAEARRTALYRPRDMHWNLAGNRLAASRIALWLAGAE
jgi:lysophospholipase L1-like esterase